MAQATATIIDKPAWVDLSSSDAQASRDFYTKLFGWRVEVDPDPLNRTGFRGDSADWVSSGLVGRQALLVGRLERGRRDVSAGRFERPAVPEVDHPGGCELDIVDRPPVRVRVASRRGQVEAPVRVDASLRPGLTPDGRR